jgi:hypothetical protein
MNKVSAPSKMELLIERLERNCETLTKNIDFHNTMLEHHQKQMSVVITNIDIRKELRTKVKNKLIATKQRLDLLKRAKESINSI